jgi:hypothetical protein
MGPSLTCPLQTLRCSSSTTHSHNFQLVTPPNEVFSRFLHHKRKTPDRPASKAGGRSGAVLQARLLALTITLKRRITEITHGIGCL